MLEILLSDKNKLSKDAICETALGTSVMLLLYTLKYCVVLTSKSIALSGISLRTLLKMSISIKHEKY